jgi:hypothetical protein
MNEDEIRAMVEQIDPEGEISDSKKEEMIAMMMERYLAPNREELATVSPGEPVGVSDDWRVNAANAARNISKDLNIL